MEAAERAHGSSSTGRTLVIVVALLLALVASPYVFLGGWLGWESAKEVASRRRFDQEAWWRAGYSPTPGAEPVRLRMVDDLLARRLIDGKTRAEVIALLGPPPETSYFRQYDLVYWLGPERSIFGIDSEWLGIRFGVDGRVKDVRLLRD